MTLPWHFREFFLGNVMLSVETLNFVAITNRLVAESNGSDSSKGAPYYNRSSVAFSKFGELDRILYLA